MTKTMKKILQYLLVAIFSLTLVLGVGNVINGNKTAQAATTTQVTTVSSLDLSNQATAQVYINNGWLQGSYDTTEDAPKVDLSKGHAMLYLSPASWAFSGGMNNLEIGAATRLEITYKNNGNVNNPLIISVSGGNSATDAAWDSQYILNDKWINTDVSGNWATITVDVSSTSYTHISCVKLNGINAGAAGEMWIKSVALVYDEEVWVPETKIDLSNEALANTYLNNAWVKGSYDSTEGAIVADLAQAPAMFYRGPAGMENLYVGEANTLEITYQIRGEKTNQPLIVLLYGSTSKNGSDWTQGLEAWKDVQRSMTSGQWATLSVDISAFTYDFLSVVKLQAGDGNTAGEMYIKSIEVKKVEYTVTFENEGETYATAKAEPNQTVSAPAENPTKTATPNAAYVFDGWYNGETKFDFATPITSDLTLTAKYTSFVPTTKIDLSNESVANTYLNNAWVKGSYDSTEGAIVADLAQAPAMFYRGPAGMDNLYIGESLYLDITYKTSANDPIIVSVSGGNSLTDSAWTSQYIYQDYWTNITTDGTWQTLSLDLSSSAYDFISVVKLQSGGTAGEMWIKSIAVRQSTYTVTYVNEDGSTFTTQQVEPNTATTAPVTNPTKAATFDVEYVFDGWYNGETKFDFSTLITSDLTLKAKFTEQATAFEELETTVTSIHFGHNATFLSFTLSVLDSTGTKELDASILTKTNLLDKIEINGMSFKEFEDRMDLNPHFDVYGAKDFSLRMKSVDGIEDFNRIVVRKGAQFPSLAYVNGTAKTCYTVSEDVEFIVYHDGTIVKVNDLAESRITVTDVAYGLVADTDNFLIFNVEGSDYPAFANDATNVAGIEHAELAAIKFFDNITFKGTIYLGAETVTEATFAQIIAANGTGIEPLLNHYYTPNYGYTYSFAIRVPHSGTMSEITSVSIAANTQFPSYQKFIANNTDYDYRLVNTTATTFEYDSESKKFVNALELETMDLWMEKGASVRLAKGIILNEDGSFKGYETSGLRFTTNVSNEQIAALNEGIENGTYKSVAYGTLIVPTDYLFGGQFTHEWLEANCEYLDIPSTGWIKEGTEYSSYYGSIVNLKDTNYARKFSGIGYILVTYADDTVKYFYAPYLASYARTSEFVAKAAIADRSATKTDEYTELVEEDGNYSPYTTTERDFLTIYITSEAESVVDAEKLAAINTAVGSLNAGSTTTVTMDDSEPLPGAYIQFDYALSENVNMIATLNYSDKNGTITVNEDVYLSHNDSTYKQFLDVFRSNGAGYGISPTAVYLHSITFKNVGASATTTADQIKLIEAQDRRIYDSELQQYLTRYLDDGSDITVGAHLGLGGALTYLAKSGLAEYSKDESSSWFGSKYGRIEIGTDSANAGTVYRKGTSSLPKSLGGDGVNLINNYDVGRQIQQAYYADVAESEYTKAQYGAEGYEKDWPYNPVQAGDQYNNTSQIIDYEINTSQYYIYIKCRPLDWAQNNVTTKSYMENWYRLNADGTLRVDNNFVEWTGYQDLGGYHTNELPAVYISQPMNYYVSNLSTDKTQAWTGELTFNNQVGTWSNSTLSDYAPVHQGNGANTTLPYGNHENWFAWASGGTMDSIGVGIYIPNTAMFTSGRAATTTAFGESGQSTTKTIYEINKNANVTSSNYCNLLQKKGLLSNMDTVDYEYMSCYVQNTSYTAPCVAFKMENYVPLAYSYVIAVDTISNMRNTFQELEQAGSLTNEGLESWDRDDK